MADVCVPFFLLGVFLSARGELHVCSPGRVVVASACELIKCLGENELDQA
jgi:hypothetical protein